VKYINISKKSLFNLKVSLNKLSSILTYAASIKLIDYDESFYKFKKIIGLPIQGEVTHSQ